MQSTRRKLTSWPARSAGAGWLQSLVLSKLAKHLSLSKNYVHRMWRSAELRPHLLERYMASNERNFKSQAAEIISLYLNPPQHAALFCVDDKLRSRP